MLRSCRPEQEPIFDYVEFFRGDFPDFAGMCLCMLLRSMFREQHNLNQLVNRFTFKQRYRLSEEDVRRLTAGLEFGEANAARW